MSSTSCLLVCSAALLLSLQTTTGLSVNARIHDHVPDGMRHYDDEDQHNSVYDHQAFLGESESAVFDQLSPAESKRRLSLIVDKMDADGDKKITPTELRDWIRGQQQSYLSEDVERQWKAHNPDNESSIGWQEYRHLTYGFMQNEDELKDEMESSPGDKESDAHTYKELLRRDQRRWTLADRDHDNRLTKSEFTDFLHPEEGTHMHSVVVDETIEDLDKDKDGKISMDEYMSDMYSGSKNEDGSDAATPEWVTREREQFRETRDKNGDGFMDREEVRQWIIPSDYDHSEAESQHLIRESDADGDGVLSKDEILDNYDLFVGSQATDFGEALAAHDEF